MRRTITWVAAFVLIPLCPRLGLVRAIGDEPRLAPMDARIGEVVAAVRAEEVKYRDIEVRHPTHHA